MVLAELGGKLRESLRKFQSSSNASTEENVNGLLSEISRALIEADVNVKLVMQLRENIKSKVMQDEAMTRGGNVAKLVQQTVMEELTTLLSPPDSKPYQMRRGKLNIILFVGLQGAGKTTTIAKFANYYSKRNWKGKRKSSFTIPFTHHLTPCLLDFEILLIALKLHLFALIPFVLALLINLNKTLPNCGSHFTAATPKLIRSH